MGTYLDDYTVGDRWVSPGRTVTEGAIDLYAGLSGDFHEVHTNQPAAAESLFGGLVAHGLLVVGITFGLLGRGGQFDGTLLAHLGIGEWRFLHPVRPGDTIRARQRVAAIRRRSDNEESGILTLDIEILNQHGVVVQRGSHLLLVRCRPLELA